jgi:hypothetical protein
MSVLVAEERLATCKRWRCKPLGRREHTVGSRWMLHGKGSLYMLDLSLRMSYLQLLPTSLVLLEAKPAPRIVGLQRAEQPGYQRNLKSGFS